MRKRLLAIIATAAMVVAMVPSMVFAATVHEVDTKDKLTTAVANMNSGDTIKLTNDISMGDSPLSFTKEYDVTLDLNGHTLDGSGMDDIVTVTGAGTVLTIKDTSAEGKGLIKSNGAKKNRGAVYVKNGKIIIESGTFEGTNNENCYAAYASTKGTLIINGGEFIANGAGLNYGIVVLDSTTLEINGGTITSNGMGISGNGSYDSTKMTINGGTITAKTIGIYHPQNGTLNINGGTIKGSTGIDFKSGILNVTGGTIIGEGSKTDYSYNSGGSSNTGDAILIENVGAGTGYEAITSVSITGGTITSVNGSAVGSYDAEQDKSVDAITGFISGGTFSGNVSDTLLAEGFVKDSTTGKVVVESKPDTSPATGDNSMAPFAVAGLALAAMAAVAATRRRTN